MPQQRTLTEYETKSITTTQTQNAVSQYPGGINTVVVAKQTDTNGAPVTQVILHGQGSSYLAPSASPAAA